MNSFRAATRVFVAPSKFPRTSSKFPPFNFGTNCPSSTISSPAGFNCFSTQQIMNIQIRCGMALPYKRPSSSISLTFARSFPKSPTLSVGSLTPRQGFPLTHKVMTVPNFTGTMQFAALRIYSSDPNHPPPPRSRITRIIGAVGTGTLLLWGKGKYLLGALKLTKFASLGSMLLTVGTYSMFFGVPYAVGMVSLILVHESGHALAMKRLGIPFSPMVFIPFMGAAVAMNRRPRDAYQEALIAFGGPALGSLGALGVAGAAHVTDSQLLFALADFGFMINLFNMIPLGMMDGGRICGAVSPYAGLVGLGLAGGMIYEGVISNPIIYLIWLAGGYETFMRLYDPLGHAPANYYKITSGQRLAITGGYFGLVGALFAAMAWNKQNMIPPEQLKRTHTSFKFVNE